MVDKTLKRLSSDTRHSVHTPPPPRSVVTFTFICETPKREVHEMVSHRDKEVGVFDRASVDDKRGKING